MNRRDALRKVGLLKRVNTANGATEAEAHNALRLVQKLVEQYALENEERADCEQVRETRRSWVYWQQIADEYCVTLTRFGTHGSIRLDGAKTLILIDLSSGEWQVQNSSPDGYKTVLRSHGLESFRAYLQVNVPRTYTFLRA